VGYIRAWLEQFGIAERWDRAWEEAVRRSSKLICNIPPDADESYRIDPSNIRG
jgi:hypothetical protein